MDKYKIAEITVGVDAQDDRYWRGVASHYAPFAVAEGEADLVVTLTDQAPDTDDCQLVYADRDTMPGTVRTDFWRAARGNMRFDIQSAFSANFDGRLYIDKTCRRAVFAMLGTPRRWVGESVTTCAMQLAYMVDGAERHRLMSHSSCVVHDGRAYIFIAPSGTGKSTHSRLWLENIADTMLLNDDHPIIGVSQSGATAYGSPWSGKTDCYVDASAPLGAIVRIKQSPDNVMRRLSPIEAYASLISSFSGLTFIPQFADARHGDIERLVQTVPCYELQCRPDAEAAQLCLSTLTKAQ